MFNDENPVSKMDLSNSLLNNKYSLLYLKVKGVKSRLLTDLIRLFGTSPSGIGYTIERAEFIAKYNNIN